MKDASTVMLLRDSPGGLEVFVARRVRGMAFAGGMTVFPGGGVDDDDDDPGLAWSGPEPDWWAEKFSVDTDRARRLVCAAARETFEECGVLLALDSGGRPVSDPSRFAEDRRALEERRLSFSDFLTREGMSIDTGRLRPAAHWITPSIEKKRYDTRFFLAELPAGQEADDETTEVDHTEWARPADVLAEFSAGRVMLLPPTWVQLERLAAMATVAEAVADEVEITPIEPAIRKDGDRIMTVFDGSEGYWDAVRSGFPQLYG